MARRCRRCARASVRSCSTKRSRCSPSASSRRCTSAAPPAGRRPTRASGWLHALPDGALTCLAWLLAASAVGLLLGRAARACAAVACIAWSVFWLYDATHWNNHFYLYTLLLGWLAVTRCSARWIPRWQLWCVRAQLFALYFFGGIAKINTEWLVHAEPMRAVLRSPGVTAKIATLGDAAVAAAHSEAFAYFMSWSGMLFDLLAGLGLLWHRTRWLTFALALFFHGMNHWVLFDDIGTFPLLGVLSASIFFAPDWPRRAARALGFAQAGGANAAPPFPAPAAPVRVALATFVALQLALPLRHYAIPGAANWTLEGVHLAWRMKSVGKEIGPFRMTLRDPALDAEARARLLAVQVPAWPAPAWERLPARVELVEASGVRFVDNPFARGARATAAAGRCLDADATFAALAAAAAGDARAARRVARLVELRREIGRRAVRLRADAGAPVAYRTHLAALLAHPERGAAFAAVLADAPPLFASAMDVPGAFGCRAEGDPAQAILARPDDAPYDLGPVLPEVFRLRDARGRETLRWNPAHELGPRQRGAIQAWPALLHAYVQHVAREWRARFASTPEIRVTNWVALRPYALQAQVDPRVDLVRAPAPGLRHAEWIPPLERRLAR